MRYTPAPVHPIVKAVVADRLSILTRRLPSGRIKASTECGRSVTVGSLGLTRDAAHMIACEALCEKLGWTADMVGNPLPDDPTRYLWMVKP